MASDEISSAIERLAVYIANLFFLTSDTSAAIVKDRDLTDEVAGQLPHDCSDNCIELQLDWRRPTSRGREERAFFKEGEWEGKRRKERKWREGGRCSPKSNLDYASDCEVF